jgi:hypothetical protein
LRADKVKRIKLASVNGIRQRLAHLLLWLERRAPDIACLQELKAPAFRASLSSAIKADRAPMHPLLCTSRSTTVVAAHRSATA